MWGRGTGTDRRSDGETHRHTGGGAAVARERDRKSSGNRDPQSERTRAQERTGAAWPDCGAGRAPDRVLSEGDKLVQEAGGGAAVTPLGLEVPPPSTSPNLSGPQFPSGAGRTERSPAPRVAGRTTRVAVPRRGHRRGPSRQGRGSAATRHAGATSPQRGYAGSRWGEQDRPVPAWEGVCV